MFHAWTGKSGRGATANKDKVHTVVSIMLAFSFGIISVFFTAKNSIVGNLLQLGCLFSMDSVIGEKTCQHTCRMLFIQQKS